MIIILLKRISQLKIAGSPLNRTQAIAADLRISLQWESFAIQWAVTPRKFRLDELQASPVQQIQRTPLNSVFKY